MFTLADAQNLSQSKLVNMVIDEFRKSALLDMLSFDNTVKAVGGNSMRYSYNRITTFPTAAPRLIGAEYTAQEAKTTPVTVNLSIFGGAFTIDRAVIRNETQGVDLAQFQLNQKSIATIAEFHDQLINGSSALNTGEFDGLDVLLTGGAQELTPASTIALDTSAHIDSNWKVFLDELRSLRAKLDGAASVIAMNSDMFAKFQSVMDRAGINLASKQNYGDEVVQWGSALVMAMGDKPGGSTPIIGATEAGVTSIYAMRIGEDGFHGVSPEGDIIVNAYLPDMRAPGAVKRGEVEMVAAVAIKSTRSVGVLRNVGI